MLPTNAKWIQKENNRIYSLILIFPNKESVEYINNSSKIIIYSTCKDSRLRKLPSNIIEISSEIKRVLLYYRH